MGEVSAAAVSEKENLSAIMKKQLFWTKICALACLGVFIVILGCAVWLAPQISTAVENVNSVATQLEGIDWDALVANINTLASQGKGSLADISDAVSKLDIEGLNKAITDLQTAVAPLARLFGG